MRRAAGALVVVLWGAVLAPISSAAQAPGDEEGPSFSGAPQQPFVCATARAEHAGRKLLGQPIADNFDADAPVGVPVAAEDSDGNYPQDDRGYPTEEADIVGWSQDCEAETRVHHLYQDTSGEFQWLDDPTNLPEDVAETTTLDGDTVPFVVRWEVGTINRFVYSIALLVPPESIDPDDPGAADTSLWNDRAVFSFQGGVGIGHHQGRTSTGSMLSGDLTGQGYAVMWSSGTRTSTHYNLVLGGETAVMLKDHFVENYGDPLYTVSVGGSGGAIQQYVYGQNHPGLIDAAIPQYSYPDMSTQTIHIGDCELLEHYFEATDRDNDRWRDPALRQAVIGLNVTSPTNLSDGDLEQWNLLYTAYDLLGYQTMERGADGTPTLSECRPGWIGATPLALNPTFHDTDDVDQLAQGVDDVEWTHADDLVNVYGFDEETGFARRPWDNVGVQYGLEAVADSTLTAAEFLDLNAQVGGWKQSEDIVKEGYPFEGDLDLDNFDIWSSRNMNLSPDGGDTPAPRTEGDVTAMNAAYESGVVFDGAIDIPIIDWRHYLERELDMHHVHQSFASRQRMLNKDGDAGNQVLWMTEADPAAEFDQTGMAFEVIDEWMANIRANPDASVAENRPDAAVDSCFDTDGSLMAAGEDVWDGVLDDEAEGACTAEFEINSSSRRQAGGPYEGGVFKCQLKPVADAIADGDYGDWTPTADELTRLQEIFPTGVCDWAEADAGRPESPPVDPLPPGSGDPSGPSGPGSPGGPGGPGATAPAAVPVTGRPSFTG